jgi:hypothetical protein
MTTKDTFTAPFLELIGRFQKFSATVGALAGFVVRSWLELVLPAAGSKNVSKHGKPEESTRMSR